MVAVPLAVLAGVRAFERREYELETLRTRSRELVAVVARALESQVRSVHALLAGISTQIDPAQPPAELEQRLRDIARAAPFQFTNTWVVDATGHVLAGLRLAPDTGNLRDATRSAYYRNALARRAFAIGDVRRSTLLEGRPYVMTFGIPLLGPDSSKVLGVLGAAVLLDSLEALSVVRTLPDGSVISALDSAGRVILRTRELDTWLGRDYGTTAQNAKRRQSGIGLSRSDDGTYRQVAFQYIPSLDWTAYVGIPASSTIGAVQRQLARDIGYAILITIVVLGGASVITRRIVQPLQQLTADATAIAAGDEGRRSPIRSDDEIGDLARAVNLMAATAFTRRLALERDMQARVEAERALQESRDQLRHAQKMDALGSFAGGIAHDFNNYLAAILGFTQLARENLHEGTTAQGDLDEVIAATQRAAALARQVLVFSRKSIVHPRALDLRVVVAGIDRMLEPLLGEGRTLRLSFAEDACWVLADRGQLEQVIVNLATNARDAMPSGGTFTLHSRAVRVVAGDALSSTLAPGDWVRLSASDTGIGMSDAVRDRAFEPFFSTKERGKGAGLGLALVYSMVTQAGGTVQIDSTPGEGTTIHLWFRRVPEPDGGMEAPLAAMVPDATQPPLTRHVLVVEDDARVRQMAAQLLERVGYRVSVASEGEEALSVLRTADGDVDLVLTDVVMPGMNGRSLAQAIVQRYPGLRIVFMSGYVEDEELVRALREERVPWLSKPFSREALLTAVADAFASSATPASATAAATISPRDERA